MSSEEPKIEYAGVASGLIGEIETVETIGFEWCRFRPSLCVPDGVLIETSEGHLVLARIEKFRRGSYTGIRRVLVRPTELNTVDI